MSLCFFLMIYFNCFYIETKKTEIICFHGSVPVRVTGDVEPNDCLYASPDHPGYAVSGRDIPGRNVTELKTGFIGTACGTPVCI